jgi:4-amino-4-deoxy-L-arabinose transferase-like glycosyltransferase
MPPPTVERPLFDESHLDAIVLGLGILLRVISFLLSSNTGGDAWAREGITAHWLQHPSLQLNFGPWLPFHFWLMGGLATILGDNVRIAGRLLSLLAGTASLFVFRSLVRAVFGAGAAQIGLIFFSLCSLDIAYSATSSSEAVYLLFILLGLLGYFRFRESGKLQDLTFSGIFLSFAAATRYEAWPFILSITALIAVSVWRTTHQTRLAEAVRPFLIFVLTAGFFPVLIVINNWTKFHHPLYAVTMNHKWVAEQLTLNHPSLIYRLSLFFGVLLLTLTPIVIVGGTYGFSRSFRTTAGTEFALITVFFTCIQFYQIASGGEMAFARYTITLGTLLSALGGYGVNEILRKYPGKRRTLQPAFAGILLLNLLGIWILSATPNRFSEKFASISPILRYPHRIESLAAFMRERLSPADHIVIDDYNSESNIVAQALGLPLPATSRAFLASITPASELPGYVEQQHPRYIIYARQGVLERKLPLEGNRPLGLSNAQVRCTFHNDLYSVYEVYYR